MDETETERLKEEKREYPIRKRFYPQGYNYQNLPCHVYQNTLLLYTHTDTYTHTNTHRRTHNTTLRNLRTKSELLINVSSVCVQQVVYKGDVVDSLIVFLYAYAGKNNGYTFLRFLGAIATSISKNGSKQS